MLRYSLVLALLLLSAVALYWPVTGENYWPVTGENDWLSNPFASKWAKASLSYLFGLTMFCIGWLLPIQEVNQLRTRAPQVLVGTGVQYLSMPLLAWGVCWLFELRGDLRIGVLLVGCVPGAMASNVLTLLARGNTSYSVCLTTLATITSPLIVPPVLGLFLGAAGIGNTKEVISSTRYTLLLTVVLPVVVGHLLARVVPAAQRATRRLGVSVANLSILWIIAVVVGRNQEKVFEAAGGEMASRLWTALVLLNSIGYAVGYLAGWSARLNEGMRRALTLEVGMQNAGLGALLADKIFADSGAAIPPVLYTFGCMLTGTLLAQVWAGRPPETKPEKD